jgi:hypothetical protein
MGNDGMRKEFDFRKSATRRDEQEAMAGIGQVSDFPPSRSVLSMTDDQGGYGVGAERVNGLEEGETGHSNYSSNTQNYIIHGIMYLLRR